MLSYLLASLLALALVSGDMVISGVHRCFYGYYPVAGQLHPVHVMQTAVVIARAGYLLYQQMQGSQSIERQRLRLCLASLCVYTLGAVDYLCNYGVHVYPFGVLMISISLAMIACAIALREPVPTPAILAASLADEMRSPLDTLRNQTRGLARGLPELIAGYEHGLRHGHHVATPDHGQLDYLRQLAQEMQREVQRSNFITDMVLASSRADLFERRNFQLHSIGHCVDQALARYPFDPLARARVQAGAQVDFLFRGSDTLLVYAIFNLIKNAMSIAGAGHDSRIEIAYYPGPTANHLSISGNGRDIAPGVLAQMLDPFESSANGSGFVTGLAFCRRVSNAFGASISCAARQGGGAAMEISFPVAQRRSDSSSAGQLLRAVAGY
jgi:two-component system CAI-1 autoinducer sensor kinase/phosphatase CqsS